MRIQLNDGTYEWIETPEYLARLVEQYIGKDAADKIMELADEADYTSRRINTDLDSYEASLEEQRSAAHDMNDYIEQAMFYVDNTKRIDKGKLGKMLYDAHREWCNNF